MSSAVVSRVDDSRSMMESGYGYAIMPEPSFSVSAASLFPEGFDASRLFGAESHQTQARVAPFKTAGDAAAAALLVTENLGSQGNGTGGHQRFFETSIMSHHHHNAPAPSALAFAPYSAPSGCHVAQEAPTKIPPSSVGSNDPPTDFVIDEFDEMLSQIPLFDDNMEIQEPPPTIAESFAAAIPSSTVSANVEVDSKIAALTAITKQHAISTSNRKGLKVVGGAKRSRKYQTGQWDHRYNELLQFQMQHGHMFVPHSYPSNQKLAQWVKRQRYQHKLKHSGHHSTLSDDREDILNKAGFIWDSHAASWQEQFQLLQQFSVTFGHCNVPTRYKGSTALNVWCKHQRKQYKLFANGKPCTLNGERLECLNSIGFNWNPRSKSLASK